MIRPFLILLAGLAANLIFAQAPQALPRPSAHDTLGNALLWEISGNGLAAKSYLYGTIHMIDKDKFFIDEETKQAIANTEEAVFEIDPEEMLNPLALLSVAADIMMKDKTLKDLVSEKDYRLVMDKLQDRGMPEFLVAKMKPFFVSMLLESGDAGSGNQEVDKVSYEFELMDLAKNQNKSVSGLETVKYQMSMFDSIPLDLQAKMLVEAVKDTTQETSPEALAKIYSQRNIEKMASMLDDSENGIVRRYLLVNRNKNWIELMAKKMKEKPVFFAVGAAHLGGPDGVIRLLRKHGYTVKPVK